MSGTIKVKFKKIDNTECELDLSPETAIEDLREILSKNEKIDIPADQMRILYKAKLLKDGHKLNEYITEDGQTIHVIRKPPQAQAAGGGPQGGQQAQNARPAGAPPQMPPGMPPFMMHMGGPGAPPMMHMGGPPGDGRAGGGPPPFGGLLSQLLQGPPGGGAQGAQPGQPPPMPNLSGLLGSFMVPPPQAAGAPQSPPQANGEANAGGSGSSQADEQQRSADEMANNLLGAIGDAASMISTQIRERQAAARQREPQQPPHASDIQGGPQPGARPRPPAPAGSSSSAAAGAGGDTHVMQLPHQALVRIGQVCNTMQGPNTNFPGPPMPQLQVERNTVVLLGSYLTNLNLQLQRLAPMMSRTGDLMQRESLLTTEAERQLTQQMANDLGQALEDIARATGSVAHFYKTLEMGRTGAEAKLDVRGYQPSFQAIVDEVQSVRTVPRAQQPPRQQDGVLRSSLQDDEEEKQADVDFSSLPDPVEELRAQLTPQEMMLLMMGANDALNHLPKKLHGFVKKKKQDYGGSFKKYGQHLYDVLSRELSNDAVRDQIHEGFDPIIAGEEPFVDGWAEVCTAALAQDPNQPWAAYSGALKPALARALGVAIDELKDGFINEEEGVFNWIKANLVRHFEKGLPPQQRGMAQMKAGPAVLLLQNQYQQYRQRKAAGEYDRPAASGPAQQPAAPQQPSREQPASEAPQVSSLANAEDEDAEMKEEESSAQQAEAQPPSQPMNMALLAKYKDVLHQDKQKIKNADEQMPHSRAYSATCAFTKSKKLPISEEKLLEKEYKASREKALQGLNVEHMVRDKIRKNLITGAGYPQAKVEEQLAKVEEIPEELVEAYVKMQRNLIKFRLANDPDFKRSRHPDAPNDSKQFEHLNDF